MDQAAVPEPAAEEPAAALPAGAALPALRWDEADDDTAELWAADVWQQRRVRFPSRPVMARLAVDPRVRAWRRRAALAAAAGAVFSVWLGWRTGLTIAALAAIADSLYRARTTELIPAAARAASARRRSRRRLAMARPRGYLALHARPIPGTGSVIDHLVIGPGGVFAVDSERWDRRLPVRTAAGGSAAGPVLYHGPYSQQDRLAHARWEAARAATLISAELGQPVTVHPAMIVYGPPVPWSVARLRGVDVLGGRSVRRYLARRARGEPGPAMDREQAAAIAAAADRALPRA